MGELRTIANKLSNLICEALYNESANNLPIICEKYGLKEGTGEEAYMSKRNYVNSRTMFLSSIEIYNLAKEIEGKYPNSELDEYLLTLNIEDGLNVISKFEDIQESIIDEIQNAKYLIWIAVAWFTDKKIANELYLQSKKGITIQIIINDDEINNKLGQKLTDLFEVKKAPLKKPFLNLMHHKFCMIDFKTVIHGSYNWTTKARFNQETISIVANVETAYKFADEFVKIKSEIIKDST